MAEMLELTYDEVEAKDQTLRKGSYGGSTLSFLWHGRGARHN
jgi:hypothetical protein